MGIKFETFVLLFFVLLFFVLFFFILLQVSASVFQTSDRRKGKLSRAVAIQGCSSQPARRSIPSGMTDGFARRRLIKGFCDLQPDGAAPAPPSHFHPRRQKSHSLTVKTRAVQPASSGHLPSANPIAWPRVLSSHPPPLVRQSSDEYKAESFDVLRRLLTQIHGFDSSRRGGGLIS